MSDEIGFTIYEKSPGDAIGPHPTPPIFAKEGKYESDFYYHL